MSRGLGVVQRRVVELLEDGPVPVGDLPALLRLTPRRTRTVVASLVHRGHVVVMRDHDGPRQVWSTEKRRHWERDRVMIGALLENYRKARPRRGQTCPNCGWWIEGC
jgi:hypothetical protein